MDRLNWPITQSVLRLLLLLTESNSGIQEMCVFKYLI
jgi:hypothetical protein